MMTDEDRTALAGEYVLGTLSLADRRRVEAARADDIGLDREIIAWEARLGALSEQEAEATPSPELFERISAAIATTKSSGFGKPQATARPRINRGWAFGAGLLVVLGGMAGIAIDRTLRPATLSNSLVAVINRDVTEPALIVRVDLASGTVSVRPVATEKPENRDFELWYVAAKAAPKSLGVIDAKALTRREVKTEIANGAILAISVEPIGGSPTGAPTGPVIYSGKLIGDPDR